MQSSLPVAPMGRNIKTVDVVEFGEIVRIVESDSVPAGEQN